MNIIENLENNKLLIIVEGNSEKRKEIHRYLDDKCPKIKHLSFYSSLFPAAIIATYIKCHDCLHLKVLMIDETQGICSRCKSINVLRNDDQKVHVYKHNIVIVGDYLKYTNLAKHMLYRKKLHAHEAREVNKTDIEKEDLDLSSYILI